jgi:hypothetical protein
MAEPICPEPTTVIIAMERVYYPKMIYAMADSPVTLNPKK